MALPTVVLICRNIFWFLMVAWFMLTIDSSEPLAILSKFYANDSCDNVGCVRVTQTSSSGTGFAAIQECVTVERDAVHMLCHMLPGSLGLVYTGNSPPSFLMLS
jgi:hypothetical protein